MMPSKDTEGMANSEHPDQRSIFAQTSEEQIRRVFDDISRIIFVISPMSTHNICFYGEINKIIP